MKTQYYLNNPNLKSAGIQIEFTPEQTVDYIRCSKDPIYFIENYCKVVSLDAGIVLMKLYKYQKKLIRAFHKNRNILGKLFRQAGKSTVAAAYFAWYVTFNDNKTAAILGNKMAVAREIFSRVQFILEELPFWLKQGVLEWNKTSFTLENGTRCFCAASSPSSVRGQSISLLLLDEFAFLSPKLAEEFIASVFPTLSSSKKSKMIIISTPKGMNHFYKMWMDALNGISDFVTVEGKWQEHPDRDQAWADSMRVKLGDVKYNQEICCQFLGSSHTLISGEMLSTIPYLEGKKLLPGLTQFKQPEEGKSYVITVDVSRGSGLDNSAFAVVDITKMPYEVVCTYYNNNISTLVYPELIQKVAEQYNNAFVLIETNDLGQEVANILYYDLEYENVYMSNREEISEGGGKQFSPGCRTTTKTKSVGCNRLKQLVELGQLLVNDMQIIDEMSTFIRSGKSYKAEEGKHDDLMMCLVMLGYLTSTPMFEELTDLSLRKQIIESQLKDLEEQMLPIGFITRGNEPETPVIEKHGDTLWVTNGNMQDIFDSMYR